MIAGNEFGVLIAILAVSQAHRISRDTPEMGFKNQVVHCRGKFLCDVTLGNKNKVTCIDKALVCNGENDCMDGIDEIGCPTPVPSPPTSSTTTPAPTTPKECSPCTQGQYQCTDSEMCLDISFVCDGNEDCPNKDDEEWCPFCPADECTDGSYHCNGGAPLCVDGIKVCDGQSDCQNGDDEQLDMCECLSGIPYIPFACADLMNYLANAEDDEMNIVNSEPDLESAECAALCCGNSNCEAYITVPAHGESVRRCFTLSTSDLDVYSTTYTPAIMVGCPGDAVPFYVVK